MNAAAQTSTPAPGSPSGPRPRAGRYAVAVLATVAALVVALPLDAAVQRTGVMVFVASVAAASTFGGLRPGIAATVLSVVAIDFFLLDPRLSLVVGGDELVLLAVFNAVAVGVCWLVHTGHARRASAAAYRASWPVAGRANDPASVARPPESLVEPQRALSAHLDAAASDDPDVSSGWRMLWGIMLVAITVCMAGFVGFSAGLFSEDREYRWGLLLAAAIFAIYPFTVRGALRRRRLR